MIGLGVGIDYALFIVTRYREHLAEGRRRRGRRRPRHWPPPAARWSSPAAPWSSRSSASPSPGSRSSPPVGIGDLADRAGDGARLDHPAAGAARAGRAPRQRAPVRPRRRRRGRPAGAGGAHTSAGTPRRTPSAPRSCCSPWPRRCSALRLGFPDEGTMPQSRTERRAYDLIADGFGPAPTARWSSPSTSPGDASVRRPAGLRRSPPTPASPRSAPAAGRAADGDVAILVVAADHVAPGRGHPRHHRPAPLRGLPDGARRAARPRAHVGGQVAVFADLGHRVQDRLPRFIAAVVLLSFLLLMVLFRSVLVPLKAAVMNLLSVGAAYGVLVMVFQWGWGAGLIGLESTVPILLVHPAVHVRDPVRALDGLRGVPALAGPRGVPAHRRQRRARSSTGSPAPPGSSPARR